MRKVGRLPIAYRHTTPFYNSFFGMHIVSCLSFTRISKRKHTPSSVLMMEKINKKLLFCQSLNLNNVWLCHAHFSWPLSDSYKGTFRSRSYLQLNARWPCVMRYCNLFILSSTVSYFHSIFYPAPWAAVQKRIYSSTRIFS